MKKIIVSSIVAAILVLSGSVAWADKPDPHNPDNPIELRKQMSAWHHRYYTQHGRWRHHHHYYYYHHRHWRHRRPLTKG